MHHKRLGIPLKADVRIIDGECVHVFDANARHLAFDFLGHFDMISPVTKFDADGAGAEQPLVVSDVYSIAFGIARIDNEHVNIAKEAGMLVIDIRAQDEAICERCAKTVSIVALTAMEANARELDTKAWDGIMTKPQYALWQDMRILAEIFDLKREFWMETEHRDPELITSREELVEYECSYGDCEVWWTTLDILPDSPLGMRLGLGETARKKGCFEFRSDDTERFDLFLELRAETGDLFSPAIDSHSIPLASFGCEVFFDTRKFRSLMERARGMALWGADRRDPFIDPLLLPEKARDAFLRGVRHHLQKFLNASYTEVFDAPEVKKMEENFESLSKQARTEREWHDEGVKMAETVFPLKKTKKMRAKP